MSFGEIPPHSGAIGIPESIFREHQAHLKAGKNPDVGLKLSDYHAMTSAWVAENGFQYQPKLYPPITQSLKKYVEGRFADRIPRDQDMAVANGDWLYRARTALEENDVDRSLFVWCIKACRASGLLGSIPKLEGHLRKYDAQPTPYRDLEMGLLVQAKDSQEKRRHMRGSS